MAKLAPTFLPLLVLLVFAIGQMNLPMVKGQCSEGLGLCGTDCNERCNKKHNGGGQGSCDNQIHPPLPVSKKIGDGGNAGCRVEGQRIYREVSRQRGDENRVTDAGNGDGKRRSVTMASREEGVETEVERAEGRV
ncbi:hypothetical protein JRO89_XS14G0174300 [Xanthoceras sorbifolium]|uniref:Uncharacterized protein n=1 Tax=Xanthoceras sorbifolium TaxID=99658 RepID=A0ABQ8H5J8_9ROSI|nr:hypothetical protein JRO89_XS14G0174300 [Xanthoceras sorbifolium]